MKHDDRAKGQENLRAAWDKIDAAGSLRAQREKASKVLGANRAMVETIERLERRRRDPERTEDVCSFMARGLSGHEWTPEE